MADEKRLRELINITHRHGVEIKRRLAAMTRAGLSHTSSFFHLHNLDKELEALNKQRRSELNPTPAAMFDSIEVSNIPRDAVAVAGYVNGRWPTYRELVTRWPHARHVSIDVNGSEASANCLDVEAGDASPESAPGWYFRHKLRDPHSVPIFYANLSTWPALAEALTKAGIHRPSYKAWVAHYTGRPHIPMGFDACQWTDKAQGLNLDQSLCFSGFWR